MEVTIPFTAGIVLKIGDQTSPETGYPSGQLQKGFLLLMDGQDLAEEAVGFGVPVLKHGVRTIFPGAVTLATQKIGFLQVITATFRMNLEEKLTRPGSHPVESRWIYRIKNYLAALIRRLPLLRGLLTGLSNAVRRISGWETTFAESDFCTEVSMIYTIDPQAGMLKVEVACPVELAGDGITEVVVMNEQGAAFDTYQDSSGNNLKGKEIGCWDKVSAGWATFTSQAHRLSFTLWQVDDMALYRGREQVDSRLSWAGFGYSFPPSLSRICYSIKIEKTN